MIEKAELCPVSHLLKRFPEYQLLIINRNGFKMDKTERRECDRINVPGATLAYRIEKKLFKSSRFSDGYIPVHDISLGGIRFLSQTSFNLDDRITLKIFLPDNGDSLILKGTVVWASDYPGESYEYLIGVRFDPYGEKKNFNSTDSLSKLKELEKQYS